MYMRGYKHVRDMWMMQAPDNTFWVLQQIIISLLKYWPIIA